MVRAIIFDCFGVLIRDAQNTLIEELRLSNESGANEVADLVVQSNRGIIGVDESHKQIAAVLGITYDEYREKVADGEIKNEMLMDYILKLRPKYKVGMLSNVSSGGITRRFTSQELTDHFDVVVASSDIGYAKPEPEAYEITADKLGVRFDECVFVDDREDYCEAAQSVGMRAIQYKDFAQMRAELEALLANS